MAFSDFRILPTFIATTRSVVNPENQDNKSFGFAIVYHFHPNDFLYIPLTDTTVWSDRFKQHGLHNVKYPVHLSDIEKLEKQLGIRINVFTVDDPEGYKRRHLYVSPNFFNEEVNLLYWDGRFAYIKLFSRLFCDVKRYGFENNILSYVSKIFNALI